jgi:hypothetical protein
VKKSLVIRLKRGFPRAETFFGFRRKPNAEWDYLLDARLEIAYVRLTSIGRDTANQLGQLLTRLEKQGLRGLVLDLRNTEGGLMVETKEVAGLFLGNGRVGFLRSRSAEDRLFVRSSARHRRFPMVCLVNGETRRTSELLAACLQDHGRALVLGERTPGDCNIQNIIPRLRCGEITFTVAVFLRAGGRNLCRMMTDGKEEEDWGVRPNSGFEVRLTTRERDRCARRLHDLRVIPPPGRPVPAVSPAGDRQLAAALDYLRKQVRLAKQARSLRGGAHGELPNRNQL